MLCLISVIHSMMFFLCLQCCYLLIKQVKSELFMDVFCVYFLWSSPPRLSLVSVVFVFSDSLNDVAPVSPILLSVCVKRKEKSELLVDVFCVSSFVFTTQIKFSECCV